MGEVRRMLHHQTVNQTNPTVQNELKAAVLEWQKAFAGDPQLHLLDTTVKDLERAGVYFSAEPTAGPNAEAEARRAREQEEEELEMAIALSQSEAESNAGGGGGGSSNSSTSTGTKPRSAKCLYDFEATEDNELSFIAGDIIIVTDSTDDNWWKGSSQSGDDGYFPASFVTYDLKTEIKKEEISKEPAPPVIDEGKIDKCLDTLYDAMRDGSFDMLTQMSSLRDECFQMQPLLEQQIQLFDSAEADLRQLSNRFDAAMTLFETLKNAPAPQFQPPAPTAGPAGWHGSPQGPPSHASPYGSTVSPQVAAPLPEKRVPHGGHGGLDHPAVPHAAPLAFTGSGQLGHAPQHHQQIAPGKMNTSSGAPFHYQDPGTPPGPPPQGQFSAPSQRFDPQTGQAIGQQQPPPNMHHGLPSHQMAPPPATTSSAPSGFVAPGSF